MKIDMHFYANGNDPFIFPLGDFMVHVHAGAPPQESSTVPSPRPASDPIPPLDQTPRMTVSLDPPPKPTPVPPPYGLTRIHGAEEIRGWFSEVQLESGDQPVRFRLDTVSGPSRPEIQTLVEGLQGIGGREVSVDIVGWSEPGDG